MSTTAILHEIFSSRQGEGPYTGINMTFVRFQGCSLRCRWCDTPASLPRHQATFRVESPPQSGLFRNEQNPCTLSQLNAICTEFDDEWIALTGGEPLEQSSFLAEWLPTLSLRRKILLETGGVLTRALHTVMPFVDVISMDLKLPSSTGMRAYWDTHREFLHTAHAAKKNVYVKMVIDADTTAGDIQQASDLIAAIDANIPVIVQCASATPTFDRTPTEVQLTRALAHCQTTLQRVSIGHQMHKVWGVL